MRSSSSVNRRQRHLSIEDRDIWLADDEIKALECILKDYNADTNNFKWR